MDLPSAGRHSFFGESIAGSGSYVTLIATAAALAWSRVFAATATIGSPITFTLSSHIPADRARKI